MAIGFLTFGCNRQSKPTEATDLSLSGVENPVITDTLDIDFTKVSPDKSRILLENEHVRVIEYSLKPGEKDNPHTHPPKTSYVISGGMLRVYPDHGQPFDAEEIQGTSEWSDRVNKHHVENVGKTTVTILLTEIKSVK